MSRDWVLLIGTEADPHLKRVADCLRSSGRRTLVWDPLEQQPFHIDDRGDVIVAGVSLHNDVARIFWRDKRFQFQNLIGLSDPDQLAYWNDQWDAVYRYADIAAPAERQVDFRGYAMQAGCRVRGRLLAKAAGLNVPDQLLTNDADRVESLSEPLVFKRLGSRLPSRKNMLYTAQVSKEFIRRNDNAFRSSPNLLQSYIPKDFELRVAAVGEEIFCVKIDSQSSPDTYIDWRFAQHRTDMYSEFTISQQFNDAIMRFMSFANIKLGMLDFIVTPTGDFVFLECNPAGQWLFIPPFEVQVTQAVARLLMGTQTGHPAQ